MMHAKSEKKGHEVLPFEERGKEYSRQKVFYPKLDGTCRGMSNGGERVPLPTVKR